MRCIGCLLGQQRVPGTESETETNTRRPPGREVIGHRGRAGKGRKEWVKRRRKENKDKKDITYTSRSIKQ